MTRLRIAAEQLSRPAYRSLAALLTGQIESGALAAGTKLPTHRYLAEDLGLSVQTVSRAYEELARSGLITAEVGRGTYVRGARGEPVTPFIPERGEGGLIDLSMLKPAVGQIHQHKLTEAFARLEAALPTRLLFTFRPNVILQAHKDVGISWLELCGLKVRPDGFLITAGVTPAMTTALTTVLHPGDLLVTEEIGHHTLTALATYLGLRLKGLAADDEGLRPDALEALCRDQPVRALFLVPTVANPPVRMMGRGRREALVEIARRHDIYIIENEAWGPLIEDRPPPLAALAPERSFFMTSFTKCVLPALRIGYLVAPTHLMASAANRHLAMSWMASGLLAEMAARWVRDGTAWELLQWQRQALRERYAVAREIIGPGRFRGHPEALHIWLPLPEPWAEDVFVSHARLQGVAVAPGAAFAMEPRVRPGAVRVCLGAPGLSELTDGLRIVARLLESAPEPALLTI